MDVAWRLLFLGRTMSHLRCLASTGLVLSACVAAPTDPVDPPVQPAPVWLDQADGTYQTITTVSVEADAPATTLRAYVDAPGSTLLAAAADADAPALALLEASLPPGVAALLPGYLDEVLRSNGVALLTAWSLAVVVQRLPTSAQLEGELVLDGETARHAVHAISFADAGAPARRFELGLRGDEVTAIATAVTATPSGSGGYLVLGPEQHAIAYGAYAHALALEATATPPRELLGMVTGCPLVALAVASKCADAACALQAPLIAEVCERGLDAVFAATRDQLGAIVLTFGGASGSLRDDTDDQIAERFGGAWTVTSAGPLGDARAWLSATRQP